VGEGFARRAEDDVGPQHQRRHLDGRFLAVGAAGHDLHHEHVVPAVPGHGEERLADAATGLVSNHQHPLGAGETHTIAQRDFGG
jgi:hypothetical protein